MMLRPEENVIQKRVLHTAYLVPASKGHAIADAKHLLAALWSGSGR